MPLSISDRCPRSIPNRYASGLIMDRAGNLYGTTQFGGANGGGTVFELSPTGTETVLYSFGSQSGDGLNSRAGLVFDKKGNLYGTTINGGAYGQGTVFKLTPNGIETVLYSFGSQSGEMGPTPMGAWSWIRRRISMGPQHMVRPTAGARCSS